MDNQSPPSHPSDPEPIEFGCSDLMLWLDMRLPGDSAPITPVVESVVTMARQMSEPRTTNCEPISA